MKKANTDIFNQIISCIKSSENVKINDYVSTK